MKKYIVSVLIFVVIIVFSIFGIKAYNDIPHVSVLMYHDMFYKNELPEKFIDKYGNINDNCIITVENFKNQMDYLKKNDYYTLSLDEFYDFVVNGAKIPKKSVLITFDDGRKSSYINAYPILKDNDFHAVMFLVTSKIPDKTSKFNPEKYQRMSYDEINNSRDVFEFASHTHNMHEKDPETDTPYLLSKSDEDIKSDLTESLKYVDKPYFAYPYGTFNKTLLNTIKESGFKLAFATTKGKVKTGDNPYCIHRYMVKEKYSMNKFKRFIEN